MGLIYLFVKEILSIGRVHKKWLHGCLLLAQYSGDQIKKNEGGNVVHMAERRVAYRVLVGKPEGKRPLGRHRYKANIEWILKKWDGRA